MEIPTKWTAADYILRGRYCETDTIQAALDSIRVNAGAVAALLVAFRDAYRRAPDRVAATPFRSLLLFSHADAGVAERESSRLSLPIKPGKKVSFDPAHPDRDGLFAGLAEWAPSISAYLQRDITLLERRPEPGPIPSHGIVPAQFRILLFDPTEGRNGASQDEQLDDLLYMINGSAPVVVHGNLAGERDVDAEMRRLDRATGGAVAALGGEYPAYSPDAPQVLLDAALRLTGSSAGNVYFATSDKRLELVTATRNAQPLQHIARDDEASVVAWVYRRGRPMVLNDIRDFHRSVLPAGETAYAELAVPIMESRLRTGGATVIGVINVEKVTNLDIGHYTYRDLTVLRLIASRFGAWLSQSLLTRLSRSLVGLALRHSIAVERGDDGQGEISPHSLAGVPIDAIPAKPTIDEMLTGIYEVTRSHSATVRLATNDLRHLVRFSAFPPELLREDERCIARTRKSVNAWVVRNGEPCYLGSVSDPRSREGYTDLEGTLALREETESELCEPIFVAGRVIGCMNLESRYSYGYDDVRDAARMVAGQIGLALQHARRSYEQEVFSMTIAATANLHEIFKRTAELRRAYPNEVGTEIADAIEHLIDPGTMPLADESAQTTQEILRRAIQRLRLGRIFVLPKAPPVTLYHSGTSRNVLSIAFEELLRNARSFTSDEENCRLRWTLRDWGGQSYLTLTVSNPISSRITATRISSLFRAPLRYAPGARAHIGAFTAGALIRSLGGDIYVSRSDPPAFVANLQLPTVENGQRTRDDRSPSK